MNTYIVWFTGEKAERVSLVPERFEQLPLSQVKQKTGATAVVVASSFGEAITKAAQTLESV